jgi:uncharacterized sulfatase
MYARLLCSLLLSVLFITESAHAAEQPNFLFVIADDCTYWDMECYGGQAKTPNLNRLCDEGLKFTNCFQAAPMCSPTRHCLYTGIYPVKSGAYPNHTFVKDGTKSIAHYLKRAGYRVALSGKTHINPKASFPFEYSGKKNNPDMAAVDALISESKSDNQPFCVFACSNEPHTPWNKGDASAYPPESLRLPSFFVDTPATREGYSKYLAEITYYDSQVGQLLELLDKHDVDDNTLVVVVSEQGNSFTSAKWTCYDMGLQSAMVVRWPGKVRPNSITDAMVEYVDVVPTFLAAANVAEPYGLDGKSFLRVLTGDTDTHKQFSFGIQTTRGINNGSDSYGIRTIRSAKYRYILNLNSDATFTNAVNTTAWWKEWVALAESGDKHAQQCVRNHQKRPAVELFDIRRDPNNQVNLAGKADLAEIQSELRERLNQWMASQGDEGNATELAAFDRQRRNRKNKKAKSKAN